MNINQWLVAVLSARRGGGVRMIGIIDADLLGRKKHRFPNLACEKIAGYWKEKGKDQGIDLYMFNLQDGVISRAFLRK